MHVWKDVLRPPQRERLHRTVAWHSKTLDVEDRASHEEIREAIRV